MKRYLNGDPGVFDPDAVQIMGAALDEAWQRVQASKASFDGQGKAAHALLAELILDMARQGERDRERLVEHALLRFGL